MSTEITHERCSELLRRYTGGELDDDAATAVSSHLESCDECRQELAGIRALLDYEYEGLTGTEVVRLDRAITAEIRADARPATVVSIEPVSEPRRGIVGIALGVAAVTLVVVVAVGSFMTGESDNDTGDAGIAAEDAGGGGGGDAAGGPQPVFVANPRPTALTSAFSQEEGEAAAEDGERTTRKNAQFDATLVQRDLERLGHSDLFDRFAAAYDVEDADVLRDDFVSELAHQAGADAGTVTLCLRNVLNESTGPALPVAGTYGRFDGRPVLVTGFVYTDQEQGPLDLYSIFVWPRGSCETPLTTGGGKVR